MHAGMTRTGRPGPTIRGALLRSPASHPRHRGPEQVGYGPRGPRASRVQSPGPGRSVRAARARLTGGRRRRPRTSLASSQGPARPVEAGRAQRTDRGANPVPAPRPGHPIGLGPARRSDRRTSLASPRQPAQLVEAARARRTAGRRASRAPARGPAHPVRPGRARRIAGRRTGRAPAPGRGLPTEAGQAQRTGDRRRHRHGARRVRPADPPRVSRARRDRRLAAQPATERPAGSPGGGIDPLPVAPRTASELGGLRTGGPARDAKLPRPGTRRSRHRSRHTTSIAWCGRSCQASRVLCRTSSVGTS